MNRLNFVHNILPSVNSQMCRLLANLYSKQTFSLKSFGAEAFSNSSEEFQSHPA